jgi:uncharacterized protein (DUF433 family)
MDWEYDRSQSEYLAQEIESTPHIRSRRIIVRDIGALDHKRKLMPATIADRFELPEAAVHEALVCYRLHHEYFAELNVSRPRSNEGAITPDNISIGEPVDTSELNVDCY